MPENKPKLKVLDLFSGIPLGGFSLGLERTGGFETVAFCEIEEFPRKVLKKHWPDVPCFEDVRKLKGYDVGAVDLICGGYPCQPFSTAGRRKGKEDDRHLWPQFSRLVAELRPTWVIGENVAGHISMGLDDVLFDLEGQGYACRAFVIPACSLGAPHRRDRTWVVGNSNRHSKSNGAIYAETPELQNVGNAGSKCEREQKSRKLRMEGGGLLQATRRDQGPDQSARPSAHVAHAQQQRRGQVVPSEPCGKAGQGTAGQTEHRGISTRRIGWKPEPCVGRVADGVPNRVDRLKGLGNAVVPQIPEMIGYAILEAEALT